MQENYISIKNAKLKKYDKIKFIPSFCRAMLIMELEDAYD